MSVEAEFRLESDEHFLTQLLEAHPTLSFTIERVVPLGRDVMPYVWVTGDGLEQFLAHMEGADAVRSITELDRVGDAGLYRIEWRTDEERVLAGMAESGGTIVEAAGDETWTFRVRFSDHAGLTAFDEYCRRHGIRSTLQRVYALAEEPPLGATLELTDAQREVLEAAVRQGYFEVPRGVSFRDLAAQFDISEQAVSERVRRGANKVLVTALFGPGSGDVAHKGVER